MQRWSEDLERRFYGTVSRYSSSAFTRMKLGRAFSRTMAPHLFESAEDARAFIDQARGLRR